MAPIEDGHGGGAVNPCVALAAQILVRWRHVFYHSCSQLLLDIIAHKTVPFSSMRKSPVVILMVQDALATALCQKPV